MDLLHVTTLFSASAAGALVSAIWEGTVLTASVVICLRFVPGLTAATRSVIWMTVFLLLVLLHFLSAAPSFGMSSFHISPPASPLHLDPLWSIGIVAVWALLSVWRGTQLLFSAIHLRRLARRATPVLPPDSIRAMLSTGLGRRSATLCISEEVQRPSVFGFFRPRILFPPDLMDKLTAQELEQVVLHESEHLRRGDDWTNLIQKIGLVLSPLNPVLLWVERRLCSERELACDDRVLNSTAARKAYAICLTRLAEHAMMHRGLSLVLGAWERQSELVRRIHRILRRPGGSITGKPAVAAAALMCGAMGCALMLARSPQLVSFAPYINRSQADYSSLARQTASGQDLQAVGNTELVSRPQSPAPQLVKAVLSRQPSPSPNSIRTRHRSMSQRAVREQTPQAPRAWVVLTNWQETQFPPRVVFAVDQRTRMSYAAVQTEDGWLIVQI